MTSPIEQAVATLRARAARARAEREATAARLRRELAAAIAPLLGGGTEAWLIGSLAWGGFGERSDVDVVLRGCSSRDTCRIELALQRHLRVPVEVLRFEELSATFRARIEREGVPLHGR